MNYVDTISAALQAQYPSLTEVIGIGRQNDKGEIVIGQKTYGGITDKKDNYAYIRYAGAIDWRHERAPRQITSTTTMLATSQLRLVVVHRQEDAQAFVHGLAGVLAGVFKCNPRVSIQVREIDEDRNRILKEETSTDNGKWNSVVQLAAIDFELSYTYTGQKCDPADLCGGGTTPPPPDCPTLCEQIEVATAQQVVNCFNDQQEEAVKALICEPCPPIPTLCELIEDATVIAIIDCLSVGQEDEIKEILCEPCPPCDDAIYTNGQGFEVQIPSGQSYEAPQITVTEVDGEVGQQAANTPVVCEWVTVALRNTAGFNLDTISSFPIAGIFVMEDLTLDDEDASYGTFPLAAVVTLVGKIAFAEYLVGQLIITPVSATYRNSDNSFNQLIASGATFTSDDITVTDVDSTTRNVPSNVAVVCEWKDLQIFNSAGTNISPLITSYPAGGQIIYTDIQIQEQSVGIGFTPAGNRINIVNADIGSFSTGGSVIAITLTLIDILNSDGLILLSPTDLIGNKTIPDVNLTDDDGAVGSYPMPQVINIDGEVTSASYLAGTLTITPAGGAAPSGIVYSGLTPLNNESYRTGDAFHTFQNGHLTPNDPASPAQVARLDQASALYPTVLAANNKWGNTWRFTDLDGNPAGGAGTWGHVDWVGHTFPVGSENLVKDHLTGAIIPIITFNDGGLVSLNPTTNGQSWEDWIDATNALTTYLGIADLKWVMLPVDSRLPHMARVTQENSITGYDWTENFFNLSGTPVPGRAQIVTAETNKIFNDAFMALRDSGTPEVVSTQNTTATATGNGTLKAGANAFAFNLSRVFLVAMDKDDNY